MLFQQKANPSKDGGAKPAGLKRKKLRRPGCQEFLKGNPAALLFLNQVPEIAAKNVRQFKKVFSQLAREVLFK